MWGRYNLTRYLYIIWICQIAWKCSWLWVKSPPRSIRWASRTPSNEESSPGDDQSSESRTAPSAWFQAVLGKRITITSGTKLKNQPNDTVDGSEILHHVAFMKPCTRWDICHIWLAGFVPSNDIYFTYTIDSDILPSAARVLLHL